MINHKGKKKANGPQSATKMFKLTIYQMNSIDEIFENY